jgi:hypothetical protein
VQNELFQNVYNHLRNRTQCLHNRILLIYISLQHIQFFPKTYASLLLFINLVYSFAITEFLDFVRSKHNVLEIGSIDILGEGGEAPTQLDLLDRANHEEFSLLGYKTV